MPRKAKSEAGMGRNLNWGWEWEAISYENEKALNFFVD